MRDKIYRLFFVKTAFIAALSLLFPIIFVGQAKAQDRTDKENAARPGAVFTNPAPITINDRATATPYPSTINVSGLTGTIPATPGSIKVTFNNLNHTFPDDITIVLVGPTGAAIALQDEAGGGADAVNLTYSISDAGANFLPDETIIMPGTYKPTSHFGGTSNFPPPGPGTNFQVPGPIAPNNATLSSVFGGTNPNGNWNLFVIDFFEGDSGMISGGWTLEINTGPMPFDNRLDFFGNGPSDWALLLPGTLDSLRPGLKDRNRELALRSGSVPEAGGVPPVWLVIRNENPTPPNGALFRFPFGSANAKIPAFGDWTGDGRANVAVWEPGMQSRYWIHSSSGAPTASNIPWGVSSDFSGAEGDYDGDNKLDPTVVRNEGNVSRWFVLRSSNMTFLSFVFGRSVNNAQLPFEIPLPGADYTGDGRDDPAIARVEQNGSIFWVIGNTTGAFINKVQWGNFATDFVIPAGDYDGDGKADFAIWRGFGDAPAADGVWYILKSSGGVIAVKWGAQGAGGTNPNRHIPLRSGDYDNDKKTDIAVYSLATRTFYVLRSSNGQLLTQHWREQGLPLGSLGTY